MHEIKKKKPVQNYQEKDFFKPLVRPSPDIKKMERK